MKKVLIVEDESIVALELAHFVQKLGYDVVATLHDMLTAMRYIDQNRVDICLLDVNLNRDLEGVRLAHHINVLWPSASVLYITAYTDSLVLNAIAQTDYSAYIVKPFRREDLEVSLQLASIKSEMRRDMRVSLAYGYVFDLSTSSLWIEGVSIELTRQEQLLLRLLSKNIGSIIASDVIDSYVWGLADISENSRRNLIYKINKKSNERLIKSKSGIGYYLERP